MRSSAMASPPSMPPCHPRRAEEIWSSFFIQERSMIPPHIENYHDIIKAFFYHGKHCFLTGSEVEVAIRENFAEIFGMVVSVSHGLNSLLHSMLERSQPSPEKRLITTTATSANAFAPSASSGESSGSTVIPGAAPFSYWCWISVR